MDKSQVQLPSVKILVADDEADIRNLMLAALKPTGAEITLAKSGDEALYYLRRQAFDLLICDNRMPGADGMDILHFVRELPDGPLFILVTVQATIELAVEAMRAGAFDFITKPFEIQDLLNRVVRALKTREIENENRNLRSAVEAHYVFTGIIGTSKLLHQTLDLAHRAAEQTSPVLLLGESGTGKDLLARSIHFHGPRHTKPFVAINCGAIPENLIESEFFGHKRGAFTGATSDRRGCFEEADGGTLFLDEIGEMPFDLQVKLLRVLEARKVRRLGENIERPVDFRIIAATNRSLEEQVERQAFREDLYYRLNVFKIEIPPLRARPEDIVPLAEHFLQEARREMQAPVNSISPAAMDLLQRYSFPGNVRELNNVLQRAVLLCDGEVLRPHHLPDEIRALAPAPLKQEEETARFRVPEPRGLNLKEEAARAQACVEKYLIDKALAISRGNHKRAAEILGISRASLYKKMEPE